MNILLSLALLFLCGLTYRLFSRRRRRRWEAEARTRLLQAMLEIDRLLGDSLTLPLALTFNQLTNTLSRRLGAPLVWLGTQESTQEPVRLIAVAGGRKSVALDWSIPVLGPAAEGSVARAIQTGEVLLCALRGDASYAHWAIGDDSRLRFGVAIPFRSLGGTMGVIGVFAPSRERLSVVRNPLWNRLADDLSVFLERRKNAVDVSHIPGYQLAISDLLREILGVSHMSAAYDLVLSLLVERMGALGAWLVEAGRGQAVSEMRWVAMRWRDSGAATQRWCANVENMQSEIGQIVRELALQEQSKIISVRDSEMLRRCRDSHRTPETAKRDGHTETQARIIPNGPMRVGSVPPKGAEQHLARLDRPGYGALGSRAQHRNGPVRRDTFASTGNGDQPHRLLRGLLGAQPDQGRPQPAGQGVRQLIESESKRQGQRVP